MAKNVYYEGKLIPAKDWDYATKRPKIKVKKETEMPKVLNDETPAEVPTEETPLVEE